MDHLERMYVLHQTLCVPPSVSAGELMETPGCLHSKLHRTVSHRRAYGLPAYCAQA